MKYLLGVTLATLATAASSSASSPPASVPTGATYASGFDMKKHWANLSPYKDADSFGVPSGVPEGCELSQVHVLHRHAERFPSNYPLDGEGMQDFAAKLTNYSKKHPGKAVGTGPLKFLNNWDYLIGEDLLTETGAATEATSGAHFWTKYGRLLYRADREHVVGWDSSLNVYPNGTSRPKPVFRTTSQERILESARWWLSKQIWCRDFVQLVNIDDQAASLATPAPTALTISMISSSFQRCTRLIIPWPLTILAPGTRLRGK